jgi:hypothetical protein
MARIEGTQSIPAELLDLYRGTLTEKLPDGSCRKRFPFRLPRFQLGGPGVTNEQKGQRQRWLAIRDKFKTLSDAERARWYAAMPQWNSQLWYFNYFQMSGLDGVAEVNGMGGGVIKDINHYTFTLPTGTAPRATIAIDTCDPTKSLPFFFGAGVWEPVSSALALQYPFLVSLNSTQLIVGSGENHFAAPCSVSLIEYI